MGLSKVIVQGEGKITMSPEYAARHGLHEGATVYTEALPDGLLLLVPRPDVRLAYVEVTAGCNLNCDFCVRRVWTDAPGEMSLETFAAVVEQLRAFPELGGITLGGFGEPLLHPRFLEVLRLAAGLRVPLTVTTNGTLLDEAMGRALIAAGVSKIVVSLDSTHAAAVTCAGLGVAEDPIWRNLQTFHELNRQLGVEGPVVGLEAVATRSNRDLLPVLPVVARKLGAQFVLISNLLPHTPQMAEEILYDSDEPPLSHRSWSVVVPGQIIWGMTQTPRTKWGAYHRCNFVERNALVVGWDGGVSPCYSLMHSYPYYIYGRRKEVTRYVLGNVHESTLRDIWMSEEYVRFRAKVRDFRFPSCVDCGMNCDYTQENTDCQNDGPSCADCLWARGIIQCP
jgi:tungsten cofactor oxidoreducase radical SAM maturase